MRIQAGSVRQLQGRTAGTVGRDWGEIGRDSAGEGSQGWGNYKAGRRRPLRDVQETQGLVISGKKTEGKREHLDLPPRSACVAYGSVLRGAFPGRKKRRSRKMFGLLGSLSFPMVQSRSW